MVETIQNHLPEIIGLVDSLIPLIVDIAETILPVIVELIETLAPVFAEIAQRVLPIFVQLITQLLPVLKPLLNLLIPIVDLFMAILSPLMKLISAVLPPITTLIDKFVNSALKPLQDVLALVSTAFEGFGDVVVAVVTGVVRLVKNPINMILTFINTLISGVTSGINGIIRALNKLNIKVPDWVAKLTGMSSFGFNLPELSPFQIPLLAKGGELNGGTAIVGEDGPELIQANGSTARVTPLNDNNNAFVGLEKKLDRMIELLEAGFGVYINGAALVGQVAPEMDRALGRMANKGTRYA